MNSAQRILRCAAAGVGALAVSLPLLVTSTAQAAVVETTAHAKATAAPCGRSVSYTDTLDLRRGPFFTTGGCLDININLTSARYQTDGRTCLEPRSGGAAQCSEWKLLPFGWTTLSTNVTGGTRFVLELRGNDGEQVGYQLAY